MLILEILTTLHHSTEILDVRKFFQTDLMYYLNVI